MSAKSRPFTVVEASISEMQDAMRHKRVTSRELVRQYLARIEQYNGRLNAVITVKHNGVVIHDHAEIKGPTGGGKKEDPSGGAIQLQGHGNPVFYRNVWIVPKA